MAELYIGSWKRYQLGFGPTPWNQTSSIGSFKTLKPWLVNKKVQSLNYCWMWRILLNPINIVWKCYHPLINILIYRSNTKVNPKDDKQWTHHPLVPTWSDFFLQLIDIVPGLWRFSAVQVILSQKMTRTSPVAFNRSLDLNILALHPSFICFLKHQQSWSLSLCLACRISLASPSAARWRCDDTDEEEKKPADSMWQWGAREGTRAWGRWGSEATRHLERFLHWSHFPRETTCVAQYQSVFWTEEVT